MNKHKFVKSRCVHCRYKTFDAPIECPVIAPPSENASDVHNLERKDSQMSKAISQVCIECHNPLVEDDIYKYCNYRFCKRFGLITIVVGTEA